MKFPGGLIVVFLLAILVSCSVSDEKLQDEVKTGLSILDSTIVVSVQDGVVTLSGEVEDESLKNASESSIREVKGVRSVVNNLSIRPALPELEVASRPDSEIREYVNAGLAANNISGVTATIRSGEILFTGEARRIDLPTIMRVAKEANPRNIKNELIMK